MSHFPQSQEYSLSQIKDLNNKLYKINNQMKHRGGSEPQTISHTKASEDGSSEKTDIKGKQHASDPKWTVADTSLTTTAQEG